MIDINTILLHHLASGIGAASKLRADCPELTAAITRLLQARTDVTRLLCAERVARLVLIRNDLTELTQVRSALARQELRGLISYPKQRDHTAHTVFLYLLGVWFYDNVPRIRSAITDAGLSTIDFLDQWVIASLLHDVGYILYDLSADTRRDRRRLDEMYTAAWVDSQIAGPARAAFRQAQDEWSRRFRNAVLPFAGLEARSLPSAINQLASAPWLGDLDPSWQTSDLLDLLEFQAPNTGFLRQYTAEVARSGYGGTNPCLDHAVGSAIILLRYCTYWYWLQTRVPPDLASVANTNLAKGISYTYSLAGLLETVVPGCRAVAHHNLQPTVAGVASVIPTAVTLQTAPVAYLAVLCDELQKWDRFPSGKALRDVYPREVPGSFEAFDLALCAAGDHPSSQGGLNEARAVFTVGKRGYKPADLLNTLDARAPSWRDVACVRRASERWAAFWK